MSKRKRADLLLFNQNLAPSKTQAKAIIMARNVLRDDGVVIEKPGQLLPETTKLYLKNQPAKYVSRGGIKLESALTSFDIDVKNSTCLDIGASTGGFTDCLLQNGATKVYAVDVGYNQLDYKLRQDNRVINIERCNIKALTEKQVPEKVDIIVVDVSFISLTKVIPPAVKFIVPGAIVIALVKPQFEAGREQVGKGGIIRDDAVRQNVLQSSIELFKNLNFKDIKTQQSPITGQKGNIEFLLTGISTWIRA